MGVVFGLWLQDCGCKWDVKVNWVDFRDRKAYLGSRRENRISGGAGVESIEGTVVLSNSSNSSSSSSSSS